MNAMAPTKIVWQDVNRYVAPLVAQGYGYLSAAENARVEAIRQRRLLFRGRHRDYFVGENRTQFPVATLLVNGQERGIYVPYNLLGLISLKGADLLFGEPASFTSDDDAVQKAIEDIERRSHLRRVLFEAATTSSWAGEAFLEVLTRDGVAYIATPVVDEIFPLGTPGPDGQFGEYRRYATANLGTPEAPIMLLLISTYRPGTITRELWQLDKGGSKQLRVELKQWPAFASQAPAEVEATGLEQCSIVWVPNQLVEGEAISEYEVDLIELQDLLNSKQSQLARILAIHANPRMYFSTGSADGDGKIRANDEAFFGDNKDAMPAYIKPEGDPDAAMKDRDFAVAAVCVRAETTPELLGIKNDAAADSARKMRLAASSPLAKAERRTAYWQPALQLVMSIAVRVELNRAVDPASVGVDMRDGLPEDELDTATIIATLRSVDMLSDERGLSMLGLDAGAAAEELERLQELRTAKTPSVLLDEPSLVPPTPSNDDAANAA